MKHLSKNEIIEFAYTSDSIKRYCCSIHRDGEELKSQMIMILMKMKYKDLLRAYTNKYLEYTCMKIASRIVNGNVKGSNLYKFKSINIVPIEDTTIYYLPEEKTKDFEEEEKKYRLIEDVLRGEHWQFTDIFNYYYKDGMNARQISEFLGIKMGSVYYALNRMLQKIKKNIND